MCMTAAAAALLGGETGGQQQGLGVSGGRPQQAAHAGG
jgi:hypothetical protein